MSCFSGGKSIPMRYLLYLLSLIPVSTAFQFSIHSSETDGECQIESEEWAEDFTRTVTGPLVPCDGLSSEWFECEDVTRLVVDNSSKVVQLN